MADSTLTMPIGWHEQTEWEVAAAFDLGVREGIRLAVTAIDDCVRAALVRPRGHGGPDLDADARAEIEDLFRAYLGVGIMPFERRPLPPPRPRER